MIRDDYSGDHNGHRLQQCYKQVTGALPDVTILPSPAASPIRKSVPFFSLPTGKPYARYFIVMRNLRRRRIFAARRSVIYVTRASYLGLLEPWYCLQCSWRDRLATSTISICTEFWKGQDDDGSARCDLSIVGNSIIGDQTLDRRRHEPQVRYRAQQHDLCLAWSCPHHRLLSKVLSKGRRQRGAFVSPYCSEAIALWKS